MLLAKQDEARVTLTDEHNDFLVVDATQMDEIEKIRSGSRFDTAYPRDWIRHIGVSWSRDHAQIRRIFLDGYGVLVVRIVIFKISSFKLQNVRLLLIFTKYSTLFDAINDATKSQMKMENKLKDPIAIEKKQNVRIIDYNKLNALYEDFVPQKELSAEQKYFPYTFIPFEYHSNASTSTSPSESKPSVASMPSSNPMKLYLEKMENEFTTLFALIQTNSKRESIFYTTPEEKRLTKFCQQETYAYAKVRARNQDLLITISELKAKLKNVEKGLKATPSVRRPLNRDSSFKNSIVTDVDVTNAPKAKNVLCVSCAKNLLILCHDKCLVNYKLNAHSKVRRALFTMPRIAKSMSVDATPIVSKTRFLSKSFDTTPVVSKTKIAAVTLLSAKHKVVQIVLWIVDSGCSKHMTGDRTLLKNFVEKFLRTVRFGNDHFLAITGDLEVAFRSKTCYVRNMEGDDLLTIARESNLYTISIFDMATSSPVCLLSKATSTKSWLWHHRLSYLNFSTINDLTKHDLVNGLLKFKYSKDHLCSACERGKSKKSSHLPKLVPSTHSKLELLHMDLCGPMRVATINEKKYILVIIDDYSRFTWVYFLHTKDETQKIIKKFIALVQLNFDAKIHKIHTNNDTEFKNTTLKAHYEKLGIMQQFSTARTP
ncbi:retrovirus-related pol polyprotein from transposon TNT 1-94 [Tanacetum coccineum]